MAGVWPCSDLVTGNMDIWSYDTGRRTWDRLTVDPGDDIYPLWSPDGTRMVFGSNRNGGRMNLFRTVLGAPPGSEELLLSTSQPKFPMDWSSDGRFLLYESLDPKRGFDIWALPLAGDHQPFAVVQTDFSERLPQFSPDGKWIAYQSDKTGRFEIYMRAVSRSRAGRARVHRWRHSGALGPQRQGTVLRRGGRPAHVGAGSLFIRRCRRARAARRVVCRRHRQPGSEPARIRRGPRRPVVRGEFGAQRADRSAHFRDSELEADAVTVTSSGG